MRAAPTLGALRRSLAAAATAAGVAATRSSRAADEQPPPYDVLVVGGGVVGLSVARECAVRGASVVLVEREDDWAAAASSGNSGIGCTGYDAPIGSLERQLLRRSIQRHPELMRSFGLSYEHVRKCGSLVVAWDAQALQKLPAVLAENEQAGDEEAAILSDVQVKEREPSLARGAMGAVWCPREAVVEPWLVAHGYAESASRCGARLILSTEAVGAYYDTDARLWCVSVVPSSAAQSGRSAPGEVLVAPPPKESESTRSRRADSSEIQARVVINCAGLYGDVVHQWAPTCLGGRGCTAQSEGGSRGGPQSAEVIMGDPIARVDDSAPFHVTPRKGQFVVLQPDPEADLPHAVIEQVASQFTKGVIIWRTLYGNVVIGPTAEDQASRSDRSTDHATLQDLVRYGTHRIPALRNARILGSYAGLRPASEHRDYQMSSTTCHAPKPGCVGARGSGWISVAGIRSTGLTCAPGIGEYVAELYLGIRDGVPPVHASANPPLAEDQLEHRRPADGCSIGVTDAALNPLPLEPIAPRNTTVPTLRELAAEYRVRGDGYVTLYGRPRRVTHPITAFGLQTLSIDDVSVGGG